MSAGFFNTLNNPLIDDPRIHHVRYQDLVAEPIGTLREFYDKYGVPFGAETETAMREYTANNRSDRYGKFHYSTDILNTDIEALHCTKSSRHIGNASGSISSTGNSGEPAVPPVARRPMLGDVLDRLGA
jgi:hypothetical protein